MRNETAITREIKSIVNNHYDNYVNNICDLVKTEHAVCTLIEAHALTLDVQFQFQYHIDKETIINCISLMDMQILDLILDVYQYSNFYVTKIPIFCLIYRDRNNKLYNKNYCSDTLKFDNFSNIKHYFKQKSNKYDISDYNGIVNKEFNLEEFFYGGDKKIEVSNFIVIYHMYKINDQYFIRGKLIDNIDIKKIII